MEKRVTLLSLLAIVAAGVPVWIWSTQIYRAPLPVKETRAWASRLASVDLPVPIVLLLPAGFSDGSLAAGVFSKALAAAEPEHSGAATLRLKVSAREAPANTPVGPPTTIDAWAQTLVPAPPGTLHVLVTCSDKVQEPRVTVGTHRTIVAGLPEKRCSAQDVAESVAPLVASLAAVEHLGLANPAQKPPLEALRVVPFAPRVQLLFSLLVADADVAVPPWAARQAYAAYFGPLVAQLAPFVQISATFQTVRCAGIAVEPAFDAATGSWGLSPQRLALFVASAEWPLQPALPNIPQLNFLLYVPPREKSPLHVLQSNGSRLETNAFVVPQWGGVVIFNSDSSKVANPAALRPVAALWTQQLLDLLGVRSAAPLAIAALENLGGLARYSVLPPTAAGVSAADVDRWARMRLVENTANALHTLQRLQELVLSLGNMVVRDAIGADVSRALDLVIAANGSLLDAFAHAREAATLAERAFFDPSMVPLLYFPDEHTYAIYMPFFVPALVPFLIALIREARTWVSQRRLSSTSS